MIQSQRLILVVVLIVCVVVVNVVVDNQEVVTLDDRNDLRMRTYAPTKNNHTHATIVEPSSSNNIVNKDNQKTSRTPPDELRFEPAPDVTYPLKALDLESARQAYERGFSQRADPVPLERWQAVANTTCIPHSTPALPPWKQRIPYVVIIGAQKAGTTALTSYLHNHPSMQYLPVKELHYFDEDLDQNSEILTNGSGIDATKVLDYFQETIIGDMVPLAKFEYDRLYALDATPNYLWLSDRVPHRLFCAAPWAKLLVLLRDPVDRAYSQYMMQVHRDLKYPERRRGYVSFEEYIAMDMKVLQDLGVLPQGYGGWHHAHNDDDDDHDHQSQPIMPVDKSWLTSDQTIQAWAKYTKLGINAPVGRGIYCIHLLQWIQAMDKYNKPRSDLKVLSSQHLLDHTNETYADILSFLQLPPHTLTQYSKIHQTPYHETEMLPSTRQKLQTFFEPFQRLLEDLQLS